MEAVCTRLGCQLLDQGCWRGTLISPSITGRRKTVPRCLLDKDGKVIQHDGVKCEWSDHDAMDACISSPNFKETLERSHPGATQLLEAFCRGWQSCGNFGKNCFKSITMNTNRSDVDPEQEASLMRWYQETGMRPVWAAAAAEAGPIRAGLNGGVRVLTIDGGGMRGVVALEYLVQLETLLNRPVWQVFDLVRGTSTGAIMALCFAHMRMSASRCSSCTSAWERSSLATRSGRPCGPSPSRRWCCLDRCEMWRKRCCKTCRYGPARIRACLQWRPKPNGTVSVSQL